MKLSWKVGIYTFGAMATIAVFALVFHLYTEFARATVLTEDEILVTFTGDYFWGCLLGGESLSLKPDKSFMMTYYFDFGPGSLDEQGEFTIERGRIRLISKNWSGARYFIPVRWGQRKYLIDVNSVSDFCELVKKDDPQLSEWQFFLIQEGNENMPVDGYPLLPDGKSLCK